MGRPKGSKNGEKSPYASLPDEWKNTAAAKTYEEIDEELAKVAKAQDENKKTEADDVDLASLKEQVKDASAPYRDATKANKLKTSYLIEVQASKVRAKKAVAVAVAVPPKVVKADPDSKELPTVTTGIGRPQGGETSTFSTFSVTIDPAAAKVLREAAKRLRESEGSA